MPTSKQLGDHSWMLAQLKAAQEADKDNRENAREAMDFVSKRGGQWERGLWDKSDGKPRYTFDQVNPLIDQVAGDMERSDFDIKITPAGGTATKKIAETYDGLVRNIEQISGAKHIYNDATRKAIVMGLSGWRITQAYVDDDAFDQDLVIERVGNFVDRVWFGPHEEPDASDAPFCFVLSGMSPDEFKERYPDESESSGISPDRTANAYYNRPDLIMVGEFLYLKAESRELALMSNGMVLEVDDEYESVADDLLAGGITEVKRRSRDKREVYSRLFSNDGWLSKERETVFQNWLPVVPEYSNWAYYSDKVLYRGMVESLMDPQRVMNYSLSREIEEGALAPRAKFFMTKAQAVGHEKTLQTLNTNSDPVQFFNIDPEYPGAPMQIGGAQVNPGLRTISESMRDLIGQTAGMFAASQGDNPGLQSGVAIDALLSRGDVAGNKYTVAREIAQRHTARIIVNAIPRVYEPGRQVRLLKEDGEHEIATIGEQVMDQQTGQLVVLHDLGQGTYDVNCESGPSYRNRQNETVSAITTIGSVDPTIVEIGSDILLNNITSPGMDRLAARKRMQLFNAGMIPQDQLTEEELQQQAQMQQQPPQEDPNMVLARAEEGKAMAEQTNAQTKQMETQANIELKRGDQEINAKKIEIDFINAETQRITALVTKAEVEGKIKGMGAKAAKDLAEAEAQDIENDATISGIRDLVERMSG